MHLGEFYVCWFREITETMYKRNSFVYDAVEFLRQRDFDGIEIDWEYPRGDEEKEKYTQLLKVSFWISFQRNNSSLSLFRLWFDWYSVQNLKKFLFQITIVHIAFGLLEYAWSPILEEKFLKHKTILLKLIYSL